VLLSVLLLFWSVPVGLLQLWANKLTPHIFARLTEFGEFGQQLYSFLASYLPVLALIGLQYLLPALFDFLARNVEGLKSNSQIQRRVLQTYFQYQLATLYVTVFSNSISEGACEILRQPAQVFSILQNKVPRVATYFINFVMARAGLSTPMLLLFSMLNVAGCGGGQPVGEGEEGAPPPVRPNYAMEASNLGMVLVLGMTYSCVAPMIMPACMVFFLLSGLVYRWLFLYVYTPEFSCDGEIWYELFNGSMIGLLLGTLSLAGFAGVLCGYSSPEFWAVGLLVIAVIIIHRLFQVHYGLPSKFISLADAREMDDACGHVIKQWLRDEYYIDPVIKGSPEDSVSIAATLSNSMNMNCCCRCGRPTGAVEDGSEDSEEISENNEEVAIPVSREPSTPRVSRTTSPGKEPSLTRSRTWA